MLLHLSVSILLISLQSPADLALEPNDPVDLASLAVVSAPSGYEDVLREMIRAALPEGLRARVDNLGSLIVEGGEGTPHRVLFTSMDEPGLVVSRITPDGYLRLNPLGGVGPGGMDFRFFEGKKVLVRGRDGALPGGVMTTNIHLRGERPERLSIDDIWVDIGASSAEEAEQAGATLLSPITLVKRHRVLAAGRVAGPALSYRYGCALLIDVAGEWAARPPGGRWTIAWTAQDLLRGRGARRLSAQIEPDEVYYVGRLPPKRNEDGWEYPEAVLDGGPIIISKGPEFPGLPSDAEVQRPEWDGPDPTRPFGKAKARHIISVPVLYHDTPGEIIDGTDLDFARRALLGIGGRDER